MTCKYLSYTVPGTNPPVSIRLPLLHIRLACGDASLRTIGLVDSGSTSTFIPLEIAEMLALPVVRQESAIGAGGRFQNTIRTVNISLMKGTSHVFTFHDFPAYVPTEPDRIPYVVLGRDSVFRKYDVIFRERQRRVLLKSPKK